MARLLPLLALALIAGCASARLRGYADMREAINGKPNGEYIKGATEAVSDWLMVKQLEQTQSQQRAMIEAMSVQSVKKPAKP